MSACEAGHDSEPCFPLVGVHLKSGGQEWLEVGRGKGPVEEEKVLPRLKYQGRGPRDFPCCQTCLNRGTIWTLPGRLSSRGGGGIFREGFFVPGGHWVQVHRCHLSFRPAANISAAGLLLYHHPLSEAGEMGWEIEVGCHVS